MIPGGGCMKMILRGAALLVAAVCGFSFAVDSPDGFVIWSEGDHKDRILKYIEIKAGQGPVSGSEQMAVERGTYADIQCVISMDGKWVAFARQLEDVGKAVCDGPGDYHQFGNYDVYVARLDGGLPAEPIRVGHGYWPSWGDDSDGDTKTLYYSWCAGDRGGSLKIMRATVQANGSVSSPSTHLQGFGNSSDAHMQCSPDGKKVAWRDGGDVVVYFTESDDTVEAGGGCHPCWGPNSYWLMWARKNVGAFDDGQKIYKSGSGLHDYHYGFSNDGKWIIGRIGSSGNDQNTPHPIKYYGLNASAKGEPASWQRAGDGIQIGSGTWCDIHVNIGPAIGLSAETRRIALGESVGLSATLSGGATGPVDWSVDGGGSLSGTGNNGATFTSDGTEGSFTITAQAGNVSAAYEITVYDPSKLHLMINCGGDAVDDWVNDGIYASGGSPYDFKTSFSTSSVTDPAPLSIYSTCRHENHSYDFADVPDGSYLVRLHFADTHGDGRAMDYAIEGKAVLSGYTPPVNTADIQEFDVTVSDGNGLQIVAEKGNGNDVFQSGIEIIAKGTATAHSAYRASASTHALASAMTIKRNAAIAIRLDQAYTLELIAASGAVLARYTGSAPREFAVSPDLAPGVTIVRLQSKGLVHTGRLRPGW